MISDYKKEDATIFEISEHILLNSQSNVGFIKILYFLVWPLLPFFLLSTKRSYKYSKFSYFQV